MVTVVKTGRASMTAWTAKTKNVTLAEKLFDRCNTYLPAVVFFAWRVYKATQRCTRRILDIGPRATTKYGKSVHVKNHYTAQDQRQLLRGRAIALSPILQQDHLIAIMLLFVSDSP